MNFQKLRKSELKDIIKDIKEQVTAEHLQKQVLAYLTVHYKGIRYKWDKNIDGGKFVKIDPPAESKPVEQPPAAQAPSPAPAQALVEAPKEKVKPEPEKPAEAPAPEPPAKTAEPVINPNPHLPPPANDLFARRD